MQRGDLFARMPNKLLPSRARFWKSRVSPSLRDAMQDCLRYGEEAYNLSIERVTDLMGLDNHWTLRKYISEVRLPIRLVPAFEHACGIDLITRYLAASAGRVSILIPHGTLSTNHDISDLQRTLTEVPAALLDFYAGKTSTDECAAALMSAMTELAWHRANVAKHDQPELPL